MSYKIKVTGMARDDLKNIYDYIFTNLSAPQAAKNLVKAIKSSIMSLREFPNKCELCKDEILKQKGYRKLVIKNYIVFYTVNKEKEEIIIARVLYGAVDYQKNI